MMRGTGLRAGIVLAGGQGTRLGPGPPKALRAFAGSSLLERATDLLAGRVDRMFVAAPLSFPLPLGPWKRVDDLSLEGGPLAGLVPALERAAAAQCDTAIAIAVDLPLIRGEHLDLLLAALEPVDGPDGLRASFPPAAVVPRTPRGIEPLVGAYRPVYVAPILRAAWNRGERAVHRALSEIGGRLLLVDALGVWPGGASTLESINTPEDWARAEEKLRAPGP